MPEFYTVHFIYKSGAVIIKRHVPQDAVDRIVEIQETSNKWSKLIITPTS